MRIFRRSLGNASSRESNYFQRFRPMYAVVRTGGKQYKVAKDSVLKVESLSGDVGSKLDLEVLMLGGDAPKIGAPLVAGASVQCEIVDHGQGEKGIAFKKNDR